MSWQVVKLEEIIKVSKGKKHNISNVATKTRYIQIDDLRNDLNIKYTADLKGNEVDVRDVIIAWDGANAGTIGFGLKGFIGSTLAKLALVNNSVDTIYLGRYLQSKFSEIQANCTGATIPHVSKAHLLSLELLFLPLAEQKRIAVILDKADAICRKRQQAIELADEFLRAVFLDMFGDPVTNPKNFPVGTIRDLVEAANYGSSAKASEVDGEYPILRMGNITYSGAIDMTDLKYIDLSEKDKPKYLVTKGDLLFNRTNSKELVGKTAVYDGDNPVAIAGYLIRVRTNGTGNTHYISGYLNSTHGKVTLQNICKSIVGMANINAQEMQDIPILIPPVELQNKYRDIVFSVKEKLTKHKKALTFTSDLFGSLNQKAFSGNL
jgi:type I restriction enzyme, S subunit